MKEQIDDTGLNASNDNSVVACKDQQVLKRPQPQYGEGTSGGDDGIQASAKRGRWQEPHPHDLNGREGSNVHAQGAWLAGLPGLPGRGRTVAWGV